MPIRAMLDGNRQRVRIGLPLRRFCVAMIVLFSILPAGCQISDTVRQHQVRSEVRRQDSVLPNLTSDRLTYRQYPPSQQNPGHQSQQIGGLFGFLNPFRMQSNRIKNDHLLIGAANLQQHEQKPAAQASVDFPDDPSVTSDHQKNVALPSKPFLNDDPPDIVEFAAILHGTDYFTPEQKLEIIALLRQESPSMRSCMMANHLSAIRNAGVGRHLAESAFNPIVQVSHISSMSDDSLSEPPIRLLNHSGDDIRTAELTAELTTSSDALTPSGSSQGEIRLVADQNIQSMRTNATFRINSPQIEPGAISQITTDTTLPTVAAPNDFTTLHPMESSSLTTEAPVPPSLLNMRSNSREALPSSQPLAPTAPVVANREIISYQTGNPPTNRNTGMNRNKINIVDYTIKTIPALSVVEDEDDDMSHDLAEWDDASNMMQDGHLSQMSVRLGSEGDAKPSHDAYAKPQIQNLTPIFQQESWDEIARRALNLLNMQIFASESLDGKEQLQDEIHLRLMNLTLGNLHDAVRPIDGLPAELQEFWRNTFIGLSTLLDDASNPDAPSRFDAAQQYLQTANLYLQNLCSVRIRNQCFINQCDGFGVYEKASHEFRRGEPIFIYAEIDNLTCLESDGGYFIKVNSYYEIVDVFGNKAANGEFSQTGKYTQSRIRDVFLLWRVDLPENIMPGKYFIRLHVVDTNHPNHLFDQGSLELNVLSPLSNR